MWWGRKCFICKKRKSLKKADLCDECWKALRILHPGKG